MRLLWFVLLFPLLSMAQVVEVPDEMYFLDTKINIKRSAKADIANSVAQLRKNKTYYQAKLDRVDAYFPIIERIFQQENIPEDFKFLAVQESSLVSDAVSTSQAVGYWQFKRESAMENGLRVDKLVDERKNISASTRAAANYLRKSNVLFRNWIYSLQSYNVGFGGTQRSVDPKYYGATEMDIDDDTHWYVKKCIAHKLAFGDEEGKNTAPPLFLFEYSNTKGRSWLDLSQELQVEEGKLREYNKWLNHHTIPEDRDYIVIVPAAYIEKDAIAAKVNAAPRSQDVAVAPAVRVNVKPLPEPKELSARAQSMYPGDKPVFVLHNELEAIKAKQGDDINKLAIQAGISRDRFLRYNDLRVFDQIEPNTYYYIEAKRRKSNVLFHVVQPGQTLRDVSQQYGVTISALVRKNRMAKGEPLQPGRELWLKSRRPEEVPVKIVSLPKPLVKKEAPVQPTVRKDAPVIQPVVKPVSPTDTTKVLVNPTPVTPTPVVPVVVKETVKASNHPYIVYKDTTHTVQQGQTLFAIARLYNTKVDSLKAWNTIDSTGVKIDQVLHVKKQIIQQRQGYTIHTVAPGETMYRISDLYKVNVHKIQEWNDKSDFTLSVGEILYIKKQ